MKNSVLKICDVNIQPGENLKLALPLPDYNSCTSFQMPIRVIHGKKEGPCLLVFSGLNGNELNGIEIINRLVRLESIKSLSGTIVAIPVINIPALINPSFIFFERNFEECFPGDANGGFGERIALILTQEILSKANYSIELKTGAVNDDLLPQVYCDVGHEDAKSLAIAFAAPLINHIDQKNALQKTAYSLNIPLLVYKAGEAQRFDESAINIGLQGLENILISLNMIPSKQPSTLIPFKPIFTKEQDWARAHRSGVFISNCMLGQQVIKDEVIGTIQDPFNPDDIEEIRAIKDGVIIGINRNPMISEGHNILKLASFIDNYRAEISLDEWTKLQENIYDEK